MTPAGVRGADPIVIGRIEAIFRYPVKSMRGEPLDGAALGFHGLDGDRRLALRRLEERGGFPWLTAGRLPELLQFSPQRGADDGEVLPARVRTPDGHELPTFGAELAADVARRHGAPVEMMRLDHGIFDDAHVSVIAAATAGEICRLAGVGADVRRFRPNIVVASTRGIPFEEDGWVGGVLAFGDGTDTPAVSVTARDVRCGMVNIDPDGGAMEPAVLKAIVLANGNHAGVYGTALRVGRLAVGQPVRIWR